MGRGISPPSGDVIRLRGGTLLVMGVGLVFVALSFTGAAAVYAMRHDDGQGQTTGSHAPVSVRFSEPHTSVGVRLAEPLDVAPEKVPVVKSPSAAQPSGVDAPAPRATKGASQRYESKIRRARPPADTSTLVNMRTCDGGTFAVNVAEKRMFDLHNSTRRAHGRRALCLSPVLTQAARSRSQDMLNREYFSHYTPDGVTVIDQLERRGYYSNDPGDYHALGENIAMGGDGRDEDTPEHLFTEFMHSEGHRANILRTAFVEVGVGAQSGTYLGYDDSSTVYTVVFGGR
jgi:uncharacterized protein YkwD